jgi:dTMP kinase
MSCFITFEGIEGCGKTTQIQRVADLLRTENHAVQLTREPGGCPIADQIRTILLDADNRAMVSETELLLYAAARAQHVAEIIRPALAANRIVLCDRFTDATYAYQGFARGLNKSLVNHLNSIATGGLIPDLTILVDCPVSVGLGRAKARIANCSGPREERFEQEALQFHDQVRAGYLQLAASDPDRFRIIDGTAPIELVTAAIHQQITTYLASRAK